MTIEEYLLTVAKAVASRSKCRRQVGCVLADKNGRILSTGYNGYPSGMKNCTRLTCINPPGAIGSECLSIHAEVNAAIYLERPNDVYYVAITRLPCNRCAALLLNLPGKMLIFEEQCSYPESYEALELRYEMFNLSPQS